MSIAPDPAARTASSQKYIKPSANGSAASSPRVEQIPASPAMRRDPTPRARSPNAAIPSRNREPSTPAQDQQLGSSTKTSQTSRRVRSPEPSRKVQSPESMRSTRSLDPVRPARNPVTDSTTKGSQMLRPVRSPEPTRTVRSPEPLRSDQTPSPAPSSMEPEPHATSPGAGVRFKTPAQVIAGTEGTSKPSVPERSASRKRSITEQARSLLRMKPSFQRNGDNALSGTNLPIQSPSGEPTPRNGPSSPTVARSLSARKAQATSISTYSASPTSPTKSSDLPHNRADSPLYTRAGKQVPFHGSYGVMAFPAHSRTTSLDSAMPTDSAWLPGQSRPSASQGAAAASPTQQIDSTVRTDLPPMVRYAKPVAALDDSEGNVNTAHPLLQKARHTRFATRNGNDLPLRHYKSQDVFTSSSPDLSQRQREGLVPPKRSSSLLYNPNTRPITPTFPGTQSPSTSSKHKRLSSHESRKSPTPNQLHQNDSAISLVARTHTAPAESELGVHPAHRALEPPSKSTAALSPSLSTTSSVAQQGATPPPIATVRSPKASDTTITSPKAPPPSRFAPAIPAPIQNLTAPASKNHSRETSKDYPPESNPKFKTTATNNTPFYLNPASSQALLDFLASTPPPSPPHPGTRTDPGSPAKHSKGTFFNRAYVAREKGGGESSPNPPFAVGREEGSTDAPSRTEDGSTREKKGWKKIFRGGAGKTEKQVDGASGGKEMKPKKKRDPRKNGQSNQVYGAGTGAQSVDGRIGDAEKDPSGYMGLGTNGEWISRKNFLKA